MANTLMQLASMRNIFSPQQQSQEQELDPTQIASNAPEPPFNPTSLLPAEGPANKAYREFLNKPVPSRTDFQPTKLNRLGAILAGVSGGPQAASAVLDKPYHDALQDWGTRNAALGTAAEAENRASETKFKNFITAADLANKQATQTRQNALDTAHMKRWEDLTNIEKQKLGNEGWTPHTDANSGMLTYTKFDPTSGQTLIRTSSLKTGETPQEKTQRRLAEGNALAGQTMNRQWRLFNLEEPVRQQNEVAREQRQHAWELSKEDRQNLERQARDASNPDRVFSARALAYRDIISQHPEDAKYLNLTNLTHDPSMEADVQQAMKKYLPGAK